MTFKKFMEDNQITLDYVFVPWSKSRNFKEGAYYSERSLNYKVQIKQADRLVIETDYMMGLGHAPSYRRNHRGGRGFTIAQAAEIEFETEKGLKFDPGRSFQSSKNPRILPEDQGVMACLMSDSEVVDFAGFEAWADEYGYDTDSRKAENIYRACLDVALKLRAGLGDDLIQKLKTLCEDY